MTEKPEDDAPVEIRHSPIHGTGLFATRPIDQGEILCEYRGERITKEESRRRTEAAEPGASVFTVSLDERTDIDGDVPANPAKFANHGCMPGALLRRVGAKLHLVASRQINPGEEILFDYGFGLAESLGRPCRCGAPSCVGRIIAEPLRPLLKKHFRTRGVR